MENLDLGTNDEEDEDEDEDEEDIASPVAVVFMILVPVYLLWVYHSYDRLGKPEAKSAADRVSEWTNDEDAVAEEINLLLAAA